MRFLLVHPAFLGDTVFLGPAIRALKARWPGSEVGVVVSPRGEPVARQLPGVDEVFAFDKRRSDGGLRGILRLGARLRAFAPDVALVSHPSARSGSVAWLSRAPRRIGYAPLCNDRLAIDRGRPFVERALRLAGRAGASTEDRSLAMNPPEGLAGYASEVVRGARRPVVGVVPGAEWGTKRWGADRYAGLARRIDAAGGSVVVLGGPGERELAAGIAARSGVAVRDTTGNSIAEALAVLARCDAVVGGDTGLVHCARALGRPTVLLFGPTDPGRHVLGARDRVVRVDLPCSPCHDHGPERCPLGHHRCMVDLPEDEVERRLGELVAAGVAGVAEGKGSA
ncbi:MAG TPA: lipopolysaccharide heptosyltransferase II [Anaeromyxobacteraceae bacterium]|nr:lipopolysaccharide heptosyltransferase II [Anaeromyxobacteraceae bacterium]